MLFKLKKLISIGIPLLLMMNFIACDRPEQHSSTKEVLGKRNFPMELWLCNYEDYDLYVAPQGTYQVTGGQNDFTKGWIFVPKKAADKGYSCVETFSYFYPYPEGVSPTSPGALTSIYGIAFQTAPAVFVRTDGGVYTPGGYASYDQFSDFTEVGVCVPEVALGSTFTPEAKTPFTIEYLVSPRLSSKDQACPQGARMMPGLNLQFQFDSAFSKPFGSGLLGDDGEGERYRFNFFGGSTSVPPPKVETNQYGYAVNSPVPFEVQKTVREDIIPRAPVEGGDLERNLQKWRGQLNPKQQLVLETIIFLGKAFKETAIQLAQDAAAINARLKSITAGAVQAVKDVSICIAKVGASGDFADWYEITAGKDYCTGEELTFAGKAITAAGLIAGQGKFWRVLGDAVGVTTTVGKVAKRASELFEEFRPRFKKLPTKDADELFSELARASKQAGLKTEADIDAVLFDVDLVLEGLPCNPFASNDVPLLHRLLDLVETKAYAQSCGTDAIKKAAVDQFKKSAGYRANFLKFTKKTSEEVANFDAHHMFPQKFRSQFRAAGLRIDDPKYLTWWEKGPHRSAAREYNTLWANFFARPTPPTSQEILDFGKSLATRYGLVTYF